MRCVCYVLHTPMPQRMLRTLSVIICIAALLFGLVRLGVGGAMFGMEAGWWTLGGEFAEVLPEARAFMAKHEAQAIMPWSLSFYFGLIAVMGVVLIVGAVQYLRGRLTSGLTLMALYLAMHGGMFFNYQLINPKIMIFAVTVLLWLVLWWNARLASTGR